MAENENSEEKTPQILVIGVGGAGCRVCEMLEKEGMHTMTFGGYDHDDSYNGLHYDPYCPPGYSHFCDAESAKWIAEKQTDEIKKWIYAAFRQMKKDK